MWRNWENVSEVRLETRTYSHTHYQKMQTYTVMIIIEKLILWKQTCNNKPMSQQNTTSRLLANICANDEVVIEITLLLH